MAKKKDFDMGFYTYTEEEYEAYKWCIKNNIYISPLAVNGIRWTITIVNNGKEFKDPNDYGKVEIWKKLYEYCKYYYDKNKI